MMMFGKHTLGFNLKITLFLFIALIPIQLFSSKIPGEIFLGELDDYSLVESEFEINNDSEESKTINFYSLCDCLEVTPKNRVIEAGETVKFKVTLEPEGYTTMSRHVLYDYNGERATIKFYANLPEPPAEVLSSGCLGCKENERELEEIGTANYLKEKWVILDIYYSPGCTTCEKFINQDIPIIQKDLGLQISVVKHNVLEKSEIDSLMRRLESFQVELKEFPIVIVNSNVIQGTDVNIEYFKEKYNETKATNVKNSEFKESLEYLKPLPIFLAGLLDGVNPCAFTTLLFLISSLFYIGKGKKEILHVGIIFSVTIFASYYLVGLGLLNAIRAANYFKIISDIIKYVIILVLVVLSFLSFYDALLAKKGSVKEMKLQLPKSIKKRIHNVIKTNTRTRGLILGTIIIGVMVTIFELTCTGQVYLPIIAYIIKIEGNISSYLYLTLYNFGFIIPLLIVFTTVYKGTTNDKLISWFQSRIVLIKALLGLLFLSMIIFLII